MVSDAGLFDIELIYEDGSSEEVFPTNVQSGKREWYDWSKFSEFAVEQLVVGQNVFLYCIAPSRDAIVKEIRINDNDQEGEYGVFAMTLADRRPDFLGPNPKVLHPGEPLQLEPPTVLLRLKQAAENLSAFTDISEAKAMLEKAERLVVEQKANPTEERLEEIISLAEAALAWLDRDEVRETLRKRTNWETFQTVDLATHYNKRADNCFDYGYGVANGKQVGIQPPYALPVVQIEGVPFEVKLTGKSVVSSSIKGHEVYSIPIGAKAGEIYFLMLAYNFFTLDGRGPTVKRAGSLTDLTEMPEYFIIRIRYSDGAVDEAFPMNLQKTDGGPYDRVFVWRDGLKVKRPLDSFEYRISHRKKTDDLPGCHVIRPRFYKPIDAIEICDRASRMAFATFAVTINTAEPLVKELPPIRVPALEVLETEPKVQSSGDSLLLENSYLSLRLQATQGKPLRLIGMKHNPIDTECLAHPELGNIFLVEVGDLDLYARDFKVVGLRTYNTGRSVEAEMTLAALDESVPIKAQLYVCLDRTPETYWRLELYNDSNEAIKAKVSWVIEGLQIGALEDNFYLFPPGSGPIDNVPMQYGTAYGGGFFFQFMDVFNPRLGGGIFLRVDDATGEYKTMKLRKAAPGEQERRVSGWGLIDFTRPAGKYLPVPPGLEFEAGLGMNVQYLEQKIAPQTSYTPPSIVLGFHTGDWRQAMNAYKKRLDTWYRHDPLPDKVNYAFTIATVWNDAMHEGSRYRFFYPLGTDICEPLSLWSNTEKRDEIPYHFKEAWGGASSMREAVARANEAGALVIPYIEGKMSPTNAVGTRLWDDTFNHAKQAQGCPGSELWQDFVAEVCGRLVRDGGVNGVYIDSVANIPAQRCSIPSHHHRKPGGAWVRESGEIFRKARIAVRKEDPEAVLMAEHPSSDYLSQYLDISWISYHYFAGQGNFGRLSVNGLTTFLLPDLKFLEIMEDLHYVAIGFFYGNGIAMPFGDLRTKERPMAGLSRAPAIEQDRYLRVLNENGDGFMSHNKEPWLPTEKREVYANRFTVGSKTIYTLYNNRYITVGGTLLRVKGRPGCHYVELLSNTIISPERKDAEVAFTLDVPPKDAAAIAELPQLMMIERKKDRLEVKLSKPLERPQLKVLFIKRDEQREVTRDVKGGRCIVELDVKGASPSETTSVDYDEALKATGYTFAAKRPEERKPDSDRAILKLFDGRFILDEVIVEF